jgi:hypothetical protein
MKAALLDFPQVANEMRQRLPLGAEHRVDTAEQFLIGQISESIHAFRHTIDIFVLTRGIRTRDLGVGWRARRFFSESASAMPLASPAGRYGAHRHAPIELTSKAGKENRPRCARAGHCLTVGYSSPRW